MKSKQQRLPDLSNATPAGIVDMCAPDQEEMNRLKKTTDYLKTALKARLTGEYAIDPFTHAVKGERYAAIITRETVSGLDMDRVRKLLTEDQLASCVVQSTRTVVRFYENEDPGLKRKVFTKIIQEQDRRSEQEIDETGVSEVEIQASQ